MLAKIKNFLEKSLQSESLEEESTLSLEQACAVMLAEVSRADYELSDEELLKIEQSLSKLFNLEATSLKEIMEFATAHSSEATSYYPFTSTINKSFAYEQRVQLVQMLWEIAYADGNLDKFEDSVVRKISELLYVSHSDFIQSKHKAAERANI